MRVHLDLAKRPDGPFLEVSASGALLGDQPVRWTADRRLLVARNEPIGDEEASELAEAVDRGGASAAQVKRYGRLLFEAAFGTGTWQQLVDAAADQPFLELAIHGWDDQEQGANSALQALRWEAIHDGNTHVAAKGATRDTREGKGNGLSHPPLPVGIVRLVPAAAPGHGPDEVIELPPIRHIPRVLFAIGSRLTDPRVRSGAEFMGILRQLERNGGSIQPRLVQSASAESLTAELHRFKPDVLHVIGHGRWFPVDDCVKLQLYSESGADDWVTAGRLLGMLTEAAHVPRVVVLSACQTASAGRGDDPVNALPFAARLVAGGVPVVIAMAGDISDTACRVFTRALTQAIDEGVPLADAVIRGRRAAFHARPDLDSTDWMLPAIFLADYLAGSTSLVDTTAINAARDRILDLDLAREPVFCGRVDFIAAMDRLLDWDDPLKVLVAYTPDGRKRYGGMRLLQELSARAVRAGRLPVLLGPYDEDQPADRVAFAEALSDKLDQIRDNLSLDPKPNGIVAATADPKPTPLANAIWMALHELVADLPADDPVRIGPEPRTVLLCHRVDQWGDGALAGLLAMLGRPGLGSSGAHRVPVVLTGADDGRLAEARQGRLNGAVWAKFAPLGLFRSDDEDPEDILAYQWWLLNPPEGTDVYAPRRGLDPAWHRMLRREMRNAKTLYDAEALFGWADTATPFIFTRNNDRDMLQGYLGVAQ